MRISMLFQKEKCAVTAASTSEVSSGLGGGAIAAIVIFLLVVPLLIFGAVVAYAYLHPTSPAGLYLIEVSTIFYPSVFILSHTATSTLIPRRVSYLIEVSTTLYPQCLYILTYTYHHPTSPAGCS